jgi:hypothetical protein
MAQKKKIGSPAQLEIRQCETPLSAERFRDMLETLVSTEPAFNHSFLMGKYAEGLRIGGLDQHGDILIRHRALAEGKTVHLQFRLGDASLVAKIYGHFGSQLKLVGPKDEGEDELFPNLGHFLDSLRMSKLKQSIIFADSAIESALDCGFDEYDEILEELVFLKLMNGFAKVHGYRGENKDRHRYLQAKRCHKHPHIVLHQGQKLRLPHRLHIRSLKFDTTLRLHFAALPRNRFLIGYVDEYSECPF